ncbi:MAG TPA: type II secretion system protein [Candidatus Wallbacteria bacterium]|nr:type II secretion system protein [Candidatus Wallbacteria bacterium]
MNIFKIKNTGIRRATTLLEISLTIAISIVMVGAAAHYYGGAIEKSKESALKQTLNETRKAIDAYYKNNGTYPAKLDDLVTGQYVYLRNYPSDPMTGSRVWIIIKENGHTAISSDEYTGCIYDIKSPNPKYYSF